MLVRDRENVMRGLKRLDTAVLSGYQIYHNYFRPHDALNGKTPAEKCGIIIEGEDKWKTVSYTKTIFDIVKLRIVRNNVKLIKQKVKAFVDSLKSNYNRTKQH